MFSVIEDPVHRNELEEFYKNNKNCFLNIAYTYLHNKSDAEDAVQEAFSEIAHKPNNFFSVAPMNRVSFMVAVVRNISSDMFNKKNKVTLEELDEDSAYIPALFDLYRRRNVTARTRENFFLCLKSNLAATYAVLADGHLAGYINLSGDEKNILEFALEKYALIPRMLCDFMEGMGLNEIGISVGMDETEKLEQLEGASDYYNLSMSHQMKLLKPDKVLEFLTAWKEKYDTRVINVDKIKQLWREVETDDREKISLFTTSRCFMEMQKGENSVLKGIPSDWLPLPFFLPDGDAF